MAKNMTVKTVADLETEFELVHQLVYGLVQASGAASQLVHQQQDPRFMMIRDAIDLSKEGCLMLAPHNEFMKPRTVIV